MIRLYVIEDHSTMVVAGLRFLFRPQRDGIMVTGFARSVEQALTSISPDLFEVFILDLHIPGTQPVSNLRKLKECFPDKPVIIYTSENSSFWRQKMINEGAMGYLTKDASREELKLAIEKAVQGEWLVIGKHSEPGINPAEFIPAQPVIKLTPVQRELLQLLTEGHTHKEISLSMGISRASVEKILTTLRNKYRLKKNIELIALLNQPPPENHPDEP